MCAWYANTLFTVPPPMSVVVASDPVSPVPVRSDVTLICTVKLAALLYIIPLTVITSWTGPNEFIVTNYAQPVTGNSTIYTSMAMISSFGRNQSGNYRCTTAISSNSSFLTSDSQSGTTRVTVGIWHNTQCLLHA